MAESLGDFKISASTDAEVKALIKMSEGHGGQQFNVKMGGTPGKERYLLSGKAPAANIPAIGANIPAISPGSKWMGSIPQNAVAGATGMLDRLKKTFTQKNMKELNKSLFIMQMASLGVAFSFMSIIGSLTGLFAGLADLGTMISTGAIGTAFAGIATGGANTTDIAGSMGVTSDMQTAAWAGFTAIVSQFKAVFDALAVKVLTPEMVAAILSVIDALAVTLAKPEVVKALQEIIKAILEIALAIISVLPLIADLVVWLGETGLLKMMLLLIVAAEILLPALAYIQFAFYAVQGIIGAVSAIAMVLGISFGWVLVIIGAVLVVIDFFIHLIENLSNGMSLMDAVTNALGQTVADVVNIFIGIINGLGSMIPGFQKWDTWSTSTGWEPAEQTTAKTTVNNITFAKSVNVGDRAAVQKVATQAGNATMG